MTVKHVLNDQLLMGYAAGVLPEAFDLVVATHLSLSDESRAMLCSYESLGGCVLNRCEKAKMAKDALDRTLSRIKRTGPEALSVHVSCECLPGPLQKYVGGGVDSVNWSSLGAGTKQAILLTGRAASARLILVPAGQSMPGHGQRGMELTLVLRGAFSNGTSRFTRGDIEIIDHETEHKPVAEDGGDCICLTATDAPPRFKGWLPRMLRPFIRI